MVSLDTHEDRPAFDRLLQEMVPGDMRERLSLSAGVLGRVMAAQAAPAVSPERVPASRARRP